MDKQIKIALAGNPNCGKTTLFNALTGSNQFVGNWPGVTVEKKEGRLKKHDDVVIMDLPGIYSLSPYTLEEVVARNYLITECPDAILNIIDGTNLERNLYLTTQLTELGIPVVIAVYPMQTVFRFSRCSAGFGNKKSPHNNLNLTIPSGMALVRVCYVAIRKLKTCSGSFGSRAGTLSKYVILNCWNRLPQKSGRVNKKF